MDKLKAQLKNKLLENRDLELVDERAWQLPVAVYEVTYSRVKRFPMDILMKMLLLAFQQADIRRAAALADMLFVEELFIQDLIDKMQRTQLIRLEPKGFRLTDKGQQYLEQGIFEEALEAEAAEVGYSAVHDAYMLAGAETEAAELPLYRYAREQEAEEAPLLAFLADEKSGTEDGFQVLVSGIAACEKLGVDDVPCLEFQLYDRKQDVLFARVWNTQSGSWDEALEQHIEERELLQWRKALEQHD